MPGGRPTSLTLEVIAEVEQLLPTVLYVETAADLIGIHRSTLHRWYRRGLKEAKRLAKSHKTKPRSREAIYLEFCNAIKKALATGAARDLEAIRAAAEGGRLLWQKKFTKPDGTVVEEVRYTQPDWCAAAWRLERRLPEMWGRDTLQVKELLKLTRENQEAINRARVAGLIPGEDQAKGGPS